MNHQAEEFYIPAPKQPPAWLVELCAWGMVALMGIAVWLAWAAWRGSLDAVLAPVFKAVGEL